MMMHDETIDKGRQIKKEQLMDILTYQVGYSTGTAESRKALSVLASCVSSSSLQTVARMLRRTVVSDAYTGPAGHAERFSHTKNNVVITYICGEEAITL